MGEFYAKRLFFAKPQAYGFSFTRAKTLYKQLANILLLLLD